MQDTNTFCCYSATRHINDAKYQSGLNLQKGNYTSLQSLDNDRIDRTSKEQSGIFHYNIRGTIIPKEWKALTGSSGKKLSRGALELYAIIVSWYNCKKVLDKDTGGYKFVPKFEGDELRKNYDYFTKELDRSQEQVRRYFAELKSASLVTVELRTVTHKNWRYHNTLCIQLNKEANHFIKNQDVHAHITRSADPCNKDAQDNLQNTLNSSVASSLEDKKIWPLPCKKVDLAVQKSGALYIDKTILKTNIKLDLVDLKGSNFFEKNENLLHFNLSELEKEIRVGGSSPITSLTRTPIAKFYPVSAEDAFYLQKASSRDFSRSYINKLLLKLIDTKPDHGFYTKDLFLSYMSTVLSNELRNPMQTNNEDFNFAMPKDVRVFENYLSNIETSYLTDNITRLKKKVIGRFDASEAYSILTSLIFDYFVSDGGNQLPEQITQTVKVSRSSLHSNTRSAFVLTKEKQDYITKMILEVFGQSTTVIFDLKYETQGLQCFEERATRISSKRLDQCGGDSHSLPHNPDNHYITDVLSEHTTFEQKVLSLLKKSYGNTIYKSWFSRLKVRVENIASNNDAADKKNQSIITQTPNKTEAKVSIFTPTPFMRDYLKTNYGYKIESIISEVMSIHDIHANYKLSRGGVVWL